MFYMLYLTSVTQIFTLIRYMFFNPLIVKFLKNLKYKLINLYILMSELMVTIPRDKTISSLVFLRFL